MLKKFYALTVNDVLEISAWRDGMPVSVERISVHDGNAKVGDRIMGGDMVSIGNQVIVYPKDLGGREIEHVPEVYWGSGSAPVVAYFENREEAIKASEEKDLRSSDPRWFRESKLVLGKILDNHEVFYIPFSDKFKMHF